MSPDTITWRWLVGGIILLASELFLPGLVAMFLGLSAMVVALLRWLGVIDRVAYRQERREQVIDIPPQSCITKDNNQVGVDGLVFLKVVDTYKASDRAGSTSPKASRCRWSTNRKGKCSAGSTRRREGRTRSRRSGTRPRHRSRPWRQPSRSAAEPTRCGCASARSICAALVTWPIQRPESCCRRICPRSKTSWPRWDCPIETSRQDGRTHRRERLRCPP